MEALLHKLEKSLVTMGNVDNESLSSVKTKGTSLDPPLYDSRTLFSMFNAGGCSTKRVVDMDKIWNDAQCAHMPTASRPDQFLQSTKKASSSSKLKQSRHMKPAKQSRRLVPGQYPGGGASHPLLNTQRPRMKNLLESYTTPLSYHGFLAQEMRGGPAPVDEPQDHPKIGAPDLAVFKEIYQIR